MQNLIVTFVIYSFILSGIILLFAAITPFLTKHYSSRGKLFKTRA